MSLKEVIVFTDGGAQGNPGPGGYGVVLLYGKHRRELSGGFRLTTNNRMELMAVIKGLEALKSRCRVRLFSDSKYVVDAITEGWAENWRQRGWRRRGRGEALNADLWGQVLDLCKRHEVEFAWLRGHSGEKENERCDQLAVDSAMKPNLPADEPFEQQQESGLSGDKPSMSESPPAAPTPRPSDSKGA
jgi:ribonuclease HI